jgi:hypothetical protein
MHLSGVPEEIPWYAPRVIAFEFLALSVHGGGFLLTAGCSELISRDV